MSKKLDRRLSYASLHNHSDFSNLRMLDSINRVPDLIDRAFELGLPAVALTDHESVSGHIRALNYYNKKYEDHKDDFKLILGNEVYLARSDLTSDIHQDGEKFYHLLLIAKDNIGHEQIRELSTRAWERSYFRNMMRTPTFIEDLEDVIGENPGHIVGTTACLGSYPGSMFMLNEHHLIRPHLEKMTEIFGEGNFFVEIQPRMDGDQYAYNRHMIINFWDDYDFIFTTDSHFLKKEDEEVHAWFLNSRGSGNRDIATYYKTAHMMSYEELTSYFDFFISPEKIEEMRLNTLKIADMVVGYDLDHEQIVPRIEYEEDRFDQQKMKKVIKIFKENGLEEYTYLNKFLNPERDADGYLMKLILEGYYDKIHMITEHRKEVTIPERMERLDYEMEQIYETSKRIHQPLSDYFITMAKMIEIIWDEADSMVGPGRGSAAGFLINYLIGITQLDPQTQELYMPPWRFIHADRPGLPDIDIDTEATQRVKIFNKIREYFNSIGADVINVCTFGTEGTKSALRTAGRSLDVDDDVISYLTSMIPNERGNDYTLTQTYYGDAEHNSVGEFIKEIDSVPNLKRLAFAVEGLVTRLGAHAAGVLILEGRPSRHNSIMKTNRGIVVSAFDLDDSEQMGGLKYDMLTVAALDKIHATMNYMLEDRVIEWQGSLRATYDEYLLPAKLEYEDPQMWHMLWEGHVDDAFQFDTMVGSQAIRLIRPQNIRELAIANSIMRLMAQDGMDLPMDTYVEYNQNIDAWYHELNMAGLGPDDVAILEPHLLPLSGVADSQEAAMQIVMDEKIANFSLNEANALRQAIARKNPEVLMKTKQMFYEKGEEAGTNPYLLDYVWNTQISRQVGYSFSILHTMAYSTITLQQMNLVFRYNPIFWKTACLSVNAGAINEEDYYNLVNEGVIVLSDEDDLRSSTKMQYGKVASAIGDMRGSIEVRQPDINRSRMGFTPDAQSNSILYGIKGIARVGDAVVQEIILNRPYESLRDFLNKMVDPAGRKLISKDRVVNLIKAGAFDDLEAKPREEILADYIGIVSDTKNRLNLNNFLMLIRANLVPEHLTEEIKCYNFTRYIRKHRYKNYYIIDDIAVGYLKERFPADRMETITRDDGVEVRVIQERWWDGIYNLFMNNVRAWIKENHDGLLAEMNKEIYNEEFEKYAKGNILDWELHALRFFYSGHPLDHVEIPVEISKYEDILDGERDGHFNIRGKIIPKYKLHTIAGTVINKEKQKGIVTLATKDSVVDVKFFRQQYAKYAHVSNLQPGEEGYRSNEVDFFEQGNHLVVTGIKRGDMFLPKVYRNSGIHEVMLMDVDENNNFIEFRAKAS